MEPGRAQRRATTPFRASIWLGLVWRCIVVRISLTVRNIDRLRIFSIRMKSLTIKSRVISFMWKWFATYLWFTHPAGICDP